VTVTAGCKHCGGIWITDARQQLCPHCLKPWYGKRLRPSATAFDAPAQAAPAKRARVEFKAPGAARELYCVRCERRARKRRARSWHHWVPQQALRRHAAAERLDENEERRLTRKLINDPRNVSPVCGECHVDHEAPMPRDPFLAQDVPASARAFAAELGEPFVALLERLYPQSGRRRYGRNRRVAGLEADAKGAAGGA
jgi:hypothetical protein